jgi:hypothetical protein
MIIMMLLMLILLMMMMLLIIVRDFGLSIELPEEGATWERFGGNIKYSAPEILR